MKYTLIFLAAAIVIITGCTGSLSKQQQSGKSLAIAYCSSCHAFPEPALLDKKTWKENVLPAMARELGIDHVFETALPGHKAVVTVDEWRSILAYYLDEAPGNMPAQGRPAVRATTPKFSEQPLVAAKDDLPSTAYVKIDEGNHWIIASNTYDSSIRIYNPRMELVSTSFAGASVVDIHFDSLSPLKERKGIFTDIGLMNPNDRQTGKIKEFSIDKAGAIVYGATIHDSIGRPVQLTKTDLDGDLQDDYVVCGFGNTKGAFYWLKKRPAGDFEKNILDPSPGSIRCYAEDLNKDGRKDLIVLMAQGGEGIFIYYNKGGGRFEKVTAVPFPPVYGSSYFELADFNKDGFKDLLYTCGDNDDYSAKALKNYHGIYIYLNDGKNNFQERYFFPMYGCYKAVARDFDRDGDLDIAAISFFPDTVARPQESLMYLEQSGNLNFVPFIINGYDKGRWISMDAGDLDGDGHPDIVVGGLIPPLPGKIDEWKKQGGQKASLMLLHNKGGIR